MGGVYHAMKKTIPIHGLVPLLKMNQHDGVDCPGCAWPEPAQGDINFVELCENGAKTIAQKTTPKCVTREFFANTTVQQMREMTDYELDQLGRLTEPTLYDRSLGDEKYPPVSWDEAYDLIA